MPSQSSQSDPRTLHAVGIFLAALFAVLVILPQGLQRTDAEYSYQGVDLFGADQEVYYAARVREVYDGFGTLGSVYYSAPKDTPAVQPALPERSIAAVGRFVGFSAVGAFFLAKIFLAIFLFASLALFLMSVSGAPWPSLLAAFGVLTAGAVLSSPWEFPQYLHPMQGTFEFLRFSRLVNPMWPAPFFFLALAGLATWMRTGRRLPLLLTLLSSLVTIYSYLYAWSYLLAAVGLLTLWFFFRRQWKKVSDLVAFWTALVILSTPYILHLTIVTRHAWYAESAERFGMILSHGPLYLGVWLAVFIGLSFVTARLWRPTWPLVPCLAVAGFIAMNQHLVTGHSIVPHHYHWYFIQPLASVFALLVLLQLLSDRIRHPLLRATGVVAFIVVCAATASVQQWGAYQDVRPFWGRLQETAPVLRYVGKNLRAGQVVYSQDVHVENLVAIYSSADVFFGTNADLGLVPIDRTRFTYFFDLWLQGVTEEQAAREFPTIRRWTLSSRLRGIYYREAKGDYANIPQSEVDENVALYRAFLHLPLRQKLTLYPIAAIITTPGDAESPAWRQILSCSREVFSDSGYALRLLLEPGYPGSCL